MSYRSPKYNEAPVLQIVIFSFNQWLQHYHNCACLLLLQYIVVKQIFSEEVKKFSKIKTFPPYDHIGPTLKPKSQEAEVINFTTW